MAAVEVNECVVYATHTSAAWWSMYRLRYYNTSRITVITISLGGELVSVACDSDEDATWLADHMVEHGGLPKSAVKVRKNSARQRRAA